MYTSDMRSFLKKPKWNFSFAKSYRFDFIPNFTKSYSLRTPSWKDKFKSPRCEEVPNFRIHWLGLCLYAYQGYEDYWERWLWIHEYNNGDEVKARITWPWSDMDTKITTWFDDKE